MGWFWDTESNSSNAQDATRNLDTGLQDFLKNEAPAKYNTSEAPLTPTPSLPQATPLESQEPAGPSLVPKQSLFQDGRYAHLWKSYKPYAEVEDAHKSDHERINDILQGYKERKAQIGRAALENCALEQWDVNECFKTGSIKAKMTMCREQNRSLERCYTMQAKFLKALGYLSTYDRPREELENIQMHADTLYHRMLDQEKIIEAAKAEGRPIPTFEPLITSTRTRIIPKRGQNNVLKDGEDDDLNPKLREAMEKLSPREREIEERALRAEAQASVQTLDHVKDILDLQDKERKVRKEQGKSTFTDKVVEIFRVW